MAAIRERTELLIATLVSVALLGFFAGAVAVSLWAYRQGNPINHFQWIDGFAQNFGTEMFGAFLTFLLIDRLVGGRQRQAEAKQRELERQQESVAQWQQEAKEKEDIRRQDQAIAIARLKQADSKEDRLVVLEEMLIRDLLRGADIGDADLRQARLDNADLRDANLFFADLSGANLRKADLSNANLSGAKLGNANLRYANMLLATLGSADLSGANLTGANLTGADLHEAKLTGTNLNDVTLPDGTKWTPDVDMERFTNPEHPDYFKEGREATISRFFKGSILDF